MRTCEAAQRGFELNARARIGGRDTMFNISSTNSIPQLLVTYMNYN